MADYTVSINLNVVDNATQAVQTLNQQLQALGQQGQQNANNLPQQQTAWQQFATVASGAISTIQSAWEVAGQVLEVSDMGENVHAVRLAFEALQGGTDKASASLDVLRDATRGVVSDMDLMSAANRLQSMGLADNAQEMGELLHMAQALGSVMSPGATTAQNIDNFTLLLANQSVRRLDSFGISADAVRQRIDELKDAGYSAQEAFNMATLEQGQIALENLGAAADAGATNIDRMTARFQNFFNMIAENVATSVNGIIGIIEVSSQLAEIQALEMLPDYLTLYRQYQTEVGVGNEAGDSDYAEYNAQRAAEEAERYRDAVAAAYGLVESNAGAWVQVAANAQNAGNAAQSVADYAKDTKEAINGVANAFQEGAVSAGEMAEMVKDTKDAINGMQQGFTQGSMSTMSSSDWIGTMDFSVLPVTQITGMIAQGADAATASLSALSSAMSLYDITGIGGGFMGDQQLFTQADLQAAQDAATYYGNLVADAMQLHEQGLITDAELANVQSTADAAALLADNAERGAEAFQNMTLAQGLGIGGGGMLGEIGGDVSAYMAAGGATDYEQQMYTQQVQMASGQTTQAQQTYDATIVPMIAGIAAQYGAEAAVQATANLQSGIAGAQYMGYTDAQIAGGMAGMTGYEAISVSQAAGQSYQNLGSGYATETSYEAVEGFDPDSYLETMTTIETTTASIAENSGTMADKMASAADSAETISDKLTAAQSRLTAMASRRYTIPLDIVVNTPAVQGALREIIMQIVGDNGGTVPGTADHPGAPGFGA